ncbi:MAG: TrkH family potassium uptake protein [Clostridia bacterium]|jgi:trk system potassium uptake protein TrkH|nr:TrkH family potassium uptake protein [Clostridia bacterium]
MENKYSIMKIFNMSPTQILVFGFFVVIMLGAFLLNLPVASMNGESIGFIDALFTSTSAVCVTGLVVVNTLAHWSVFGKVVIICLIQIGGLGFMSLVTMLFLLLGKRITLKGRLLIQEAFNQNDMSGMVKLVLNIIKGTILVELIGAIMLSFVFIPEHGIKRGIFYSIFHSISAFCNAGFDIVGDSSLTPYVYNPMVNITIMLLIIIGGIGFTVWIDFIETTKIKIREKLSLKKWFDKFSLHTKLVLSLTTFFLVVGFIFFFIAEYRNPETLGSMTLGQKVWASMFQSVTPRTAGFNTIDLGAMSYASKFMTILLMFVGGSPAGTAGGIKTVTVGILILTVLSTLRGEDKVNVYGRKISFSLVNRALAVIMIAMSIVVGVTMLLSITEAPSFLTGGAGSVCAYPSFMDLFFEATSAFATVGLTLGITSSLSVAGKIIIAITMFIGRLGPVTIALALLLKQDDNKNKIEYPEEKILVG